MGLFGKKAQAEEPADDAVFYSTPFGETKDGQQKLFMLSRDGVAYVPVFRSRASLRDFFERMNRAGYLIMEGKP